MIGGRPGAAEFPEYYRNYIATVPDGPILEFLESHGEDLVELLSSVPEGLEGHRYAPEKWSIREVVAHVIDAERMFTTRALAFARGDRGPYPSFDENHYATTCGAEGRTLGDLAEEFAALRRSTTIFYRTLPSEAWDRTGVASGKDFNVRSLAWITAGHAVHHGALIRDRYLAGTADGA